MRKVDWYVGAIIYGFIVGCLLADYVSKIQQ